METQDSTVKHTTPAYMEKSCWLKKSQPDLYTFIGLSHT